MKKQKNIYSAFLQHKKWSRLKGHILSVFTELLQEANPEQSSKKHGSYNWFKILLLSFTD